MLRAAEGEAVQSASVLNAVHKSIIESVQKTFKKPTHAKVKKLKGTINKKLGAFYKDYFPKELIEMQTEVIAKEVIWNNDLLESVRNKEALVAPRTVVVGTQSRKAKSIVRQISAVANKRPYQGKTFDKHIAKLWPNEAKRIRGALTTGFNQGKNIAQITRDVKAVTGRATRDVKTITRSFFMHNATEAKESVYNLNSDLVESIIWVSTLDSRTTPLICGARDGAEYTVKDKEPIDHPYSWDGGPGRIHWNCRSSSVPNIKGLNKASPRPSVVAGENYKRGDNVTRTGRVRKPTKVARDKGTFKGEMRTTRTRYEGWLKEQSKTNIDYVSDILGSKKKAQLFRDGKITLKQLGAASPVSRVTSRKKI